MSIYHFRLLTRRKLSAPKMLYALSKAISDHTKRKASKDRQTETNREMDRQTGRETADWTVDHTPRRTAPSSDIYVYIKICIICAWRQLLSLSLCLSDSFYKVKGGVGYYDYQITFWHAFLVFVRRASNATLVPNSLAIMCLLYAFLSCKYAALIATSWPRLLPDCPLFDCHWPRLITWLS